MIVFFNDTATTEIYTLSLHDALPIWTDAPEGPHERHKNKHLRIGDMVIRVAPIGIRHIDRKSTRLNSSHANISYAVFCLKKKKIIETFRSRHSPVPPPARDARCASPW